MVRNEMKKWEGVMENLKKRTQTRIKLRKAESRKK